MLEIAKEMGRALGCEPITSGASQGLIPTEGASVEDVEQKVRRELGRLDLLDHATIMVAACERTESGFAQQVAGLKARMRWSQMRSPSVVYPPLHGELVCAVDRIRPALPRHDLAEKRNQSDFTYGRRKLGRERKKKLPLE